MMKALYASSSRRPAKAAVDVLDQPGREDLPGTTVAVGVARVAGLLAV
jgi:hypothetical protein